MAARDRGWPRRSPRAAHDAPLGAPAKPTYANSCQEVLSRVRVPADGWGGCPTCSMLAEELQEPLAEPIHGLDLRRYLAQFESQRHGGEDRPHHGLCTDIVLGLAVVEVNDDRD